MDWAKVITSTLDNEVVDLLGKGWTFRPQHSKIYITERNQDAKEFAPGNLPLRR